ncbi:MAG TPA: ester cyclase [Ktedonobacteraceae bacterium]|nr:ester cyclase [Ktedonobacteraceae bacterium]
MVTEVNTVTEVTELAEANKALASRFYEEGWNQGNLAVFDELLASNHVLHDPGFPEAIRGLEGFKQYYASYGSAFPGNQLTVEDYIAEGDTVVSRWTGRGTHEGDLMGIAPTGKQVTVTGISIQRIANGKIVEEWSNYDMLGMLQQLGVAPMPGQASS